MNKIAITSTFVLALATGSFAQTFHLTDLGTLGGTTSSPTGINASGQVVGYSTTAGGFTHAFAYSGAGMVDLGTMGGNNSRAKAINDSGLIIGESDKADLHLHAFAYSGGSMQDLGTVAGNISSAHALNNNGLIVGTSSTSTPNVFRAAKFSPNTDIGVLPGGLFAYADGVNDAGVIVGSSNNSVQQELGFVYQGGVMTQLSLAGTSQTNAIGINTSGQIVGYAYFSGTVTRGWIRSTAGVMSDLGALPGMNSSNVYAINDAGMIVGRSGSTISSTDNRGVLITGGVMKDLNTMVDSSASGWTIISAQAINSTGSIAAIAQNASGATHAVVLSTVPEPSSLLVMATSIGLLAARRRRRKA